METISLEVTGLHCEACEANVELFVSQLGGVEEVEASRARGLVRVRFDPGRTSSGSIRARVEDLGYQVRSG